jgi:hypothetical protein
MKKVTRSLIRPLRDGVVIAARLIVAAGTSFGQVTRHTREQLQIFRILNPEQVVPAGLNVLVQLGLGRAWRP